MAAYATDVGQRIRAARERNRPDLSQEAAAHEVGVSVKQYGRWERGESQPREDKWQRLCDVLRVSVDDIRGVPPIAPENELRDQLDRIERKVDQVLEELGAMRVAQAVTVAGEAESESTQPGSADTSRTRATTSADA